MDVELYQKVSSPLLCGSWGWGPRYLAGARGEGIQDAVNFTLSKTTISQSPLPLGEGPGEREEGPGERETIHTPKTHIRNSPTPNYLAPSLFPASLWISGEKGVVIHSIGDNPGGEPQLIHISTAFHNRFPRRFHRGGR